MSKIIYKHHLDCLRHTPNEPQTTILVKGGKKIKEPQMMKILLTRCL